jgi:hypothetical protein
MKYICNLLIHQTSGQRWRRMRWRGRVLRGRETLEREIALPNLEVQEPVLRSYNYKMALVDQYTAQRDMELYRCRDVIKNHTLHR